jgi:hypothetical protein
MHKTPGITRLIHDNFWIVLSFAFARPVIGKLMDDRFVGEWKYLRKSVYELAEIRADRALLEMGTQLRVLDDQEKLSYIFEQVKPPPFGTVTQADDTITDLHFRDMTNKIMHAASFEWNLSTPEDPSIICLPHDSARWKRAQINLVAVMGFMGTLMV